MKFDIKSLELDKILNLISGYAKSKLGNYAIKELIPSNNINDIREQLNEVNDAYNAIIKYDNIDLLDLSDIKSIVRRTIIGGILNEMELLEIAKSITICENLLKYKSYVNGQKIDISNLDKFFSNIKVDLKLKTEIKSSIDQNGLVLDNASSKLLLIRRSLLLANNRLRSKMNELLVSNASNLTDSIITTRQNRLCLPVKVEAKNSFKGIIHDESSSGTTVFIEPEACVVINNQIESLQNEERNEILEILKGLSLLVNSKSDILLNNIDIITSLDVIFAKATYAIKNDMNMPILNDIGNIHLINAKHPLIDKDKVVPIDLEIGNKYNSIIITGPNTGGKTVALKTTGLLSLMAQTGIFIPASKDSRINVFDNILVDIGDEQSIEQSLSTFSSHMTHISSILKEVTQNSLVLLDELGSGTDPKEGASLAISIIDYLKNIKAKVITTTHYSDLKAFAYDNKDIINASVEFNSETLMPTYKLLIGIPGKSNALSIAKRLGINNEIINRAKELISSNNSNQETLIEKLDEENQKLSSIKNEYLHMISEYNSKLEALNKEKEQITLEHKNIINRAKKEANDILINAKEDANKLLKDIDKIKNDSNIKEHEIADIKFVARNLNSKNVDNNIFDEDLKVGDYVFIESYSQDGQIMSIKKDKYSVQVGQFLIDFKKKDLRLTKPPVSTKKKVKKPVSTFSLSDPHFELDLRGFRYEEVHDEIERFIDKAYLANMSMIHIIHGFGTGAVRDAVNAYLKSSPYVKNYRYGGEGEGLNGVTVVYLK